jgi:hypothetical protein
LGGGGGRVVSKATPVGRERVMGIINICRLITSKQKHSSEKNGKVLKNFRKRLKKTEKVTLALVTRQTRVIISECCSAHR